MEERLYKIFSNVNDWLKFAEGKNLGLLTLNLALCVGLIQLFSSKDCNINNLVFIICFGGNVISFLAALFSISPIIGKITKKGFVNTGICKLSKAIDKEVKFENIHFYGYLKDLTVDDFEEKFMSKLSITDYKFNVYEKELSQQIISNSIITFYKYQLFKIGCFITMLGILLSLIVLVIH